MRPAAKSIRLYFNIILNDLHFCNRDLQCWSLKSVPSNVAQKLFFRRKILLQSKVSQGAFSQNDGGRFWSRLSEEKKNVASIFNEHRKFFSAAWFKMPRTSKTLLVNYQPLWNQPCLFIWRQELNGAMPKRQLSLAKHQTSLTLTDRGQFFVNWKSGGAVRLMH